MSISNTSSNNVSVEEQAKPHAEFKGLTPNQHFEALAKKIESLFSTGEWVMPFAAARPHRNMVSQNRYNGMNSLLLAITALEREFKSRQWLTYKQLTAKGWHVEKGDFGCPVQYFSTFKVDNDQDTESKDANKTRSFVKCYKVFNLDQCLDKNNKPVTCHEVDTLPNLSEQQDICFQIAAKMEVSIIHQAECGSAFYVPSKNVIQLPMPSEFSSQEEYINTLLHELGHATAPILRKTWEKGAFGSVPYAKEEVVAELTAVFASSMFGVEKIPLANHAAYVESWLKKAKSDSPHFFSTAIKESTKAANFMWDCIYPDETDSDLP